MKKSVFVMACLAVVLCQGTPVSAKWLHIGKNKKGDTYMVSDQTQPLAKGCVLAQVLKKYGTVQQTKWGPVRFRKYVIRLCCQTMIQQQLGMVLYNRAKQKIKTIKARGRPFVCKGSLCKQVHGKLCGPQAKP